ISLSLISFQMIRVISSPSISTMGLVTLIFAIKLRSRWSADAASERGDRGVQRSTRPHCGRRLDGIGQVVTADVDRLALRADQFAIDLGLVLGERLGQRFEAGLQVRVL